MVTVNGTGGSSQGSMLRVLGAARKREVKATQNLSIIVLFFMICWIPLYTINFFQAYRQPWKAPATLTLCCIILSHLNSAGNPLLYAYHLRDFRAALRSLLCGPAVEKVMGRDNTAYQDTPTERMKRSNSVSTLYPAAPTGPVVRGHRRSMTVPLYQPENGHIFKIAGDQFLTHRILELNLSCIMENSQSEEGKSVSVLGLHTLDRTVTDVTNLQTTLDTPDQSKETIVQDSPMGFMDERTHDIYALGLVESPTSPGMNGKVHNLADVEDLGVRENHSAD